MGLVKPCQVLRVHVGRWFSSSANIPCLSWNKKRKKKGIKWRVGCVWLFYIYFQINVHPLKLSMYESVIRSLIKSKRLMYGIYIGHEFFMMIMLIIHRRDVVDPCRQNWKKTYSKSKGILENWIMYWYRQQTINWWTKRPQGALVAGMYK